MFNLNKNTFGFELLYLLKHKKVLTFVKLWTELSCFSSKEVKLHKKVREDVYRIS